jgi:hypothetical protein
LSFILVFILLSPNVAVAKISNFRPAYTATSFKQWLFFIISCCDVEVQAKLERGIVVVEQWMLESFRKYVGMLLDPTNENYEVNAAGNLPIGMISSPSFVCNQFIQRAPRTWQLYGLKKLK